MRILAALGILALNGASAADAKVQQANTITVCVDQGNTKISLPIAESVTSAIFANIGFRVEWKGDVRLCTSERGDIQIYVLEKATKNVSSDALGYAMPFQGSIIVVFADRLRMYATQTLRWSYLAGYVMAHEIAHLLQGLSRHSATGIMKASLDRQDVEKCFRHSMTFADEDIQMIRTGFEVRMRTLELISQFHRNNGSKIVTVSK
jgi:hypothetical protein